MCGVVTCVMDDVVCGGGGGRCAHVTSNCLSLMRLHHSLPWKHVTIPVERDRQQL